MIVVIGQANLMEIVPANHAVGGSTNLLNCRQQEREQDTDDGNDDKQFDERKGIPARFTA
jgi:hypothetical protein